MLKEAAVRSKEQKKQVQKTFTAVRRAKKALQQEVRVAQDHAAKMNCVSTRATPRMARASSRATAEAAGLHRKRRCLARDTMRASALRAAAAWSTKQAAKDKKSARKFYDGIKKRKVLLKQVANLQEEVAKAKRRYSLLRKRLDEALEEVRHHENEKMKALDRIKELEDRPAGQCL